MHNVLLVLAMVRLYWQCTGKAMGAVGCGDLSAETRELRDY